MSDNIQKATMKGSLEPIEMERAKNKKQSDALKGVISFGVFMLGGALLITLLVLGDSTEEKQVLTTEYHPDALKYAEKDCFEKNGTHITTNNTAIYCWVDGDPQEFKLG